MKKTKTERVVNMLKVLEDNGYNLSDLGDLINHIDRLADDASDNAAAPKKDNVPTLEMVVSRYLVGLGIPQHLKGYSYLRWTLEKFVRHPEMSSNASVTKEVYPDCANEFSTTGSRVERAMRHSIEVAWDVADLDKMNLIQKIFGGMISPNKGKPTNTMFLSAVADYIRLHEEFE